MIFDKPVPWFFTQKFLWEMFRGRNAHIFQIKQLAFHSSAANVMVLTVQDPQCISIKYQDAYPEKEQYITIY
jgi:hypothetical protein